MPQFDTQDSKFFLRTASPEDAALVVRFMKKLGTYQNMADEITATPERIKRLLTLKQGEAVFGSYDGEIVGFAYFHQKSSAFTGLSGFASGRLITEIDLIREGGRLT